MHCAQHLPGEGTPLNLEVTGDHFLHTTIPVMCSCHLDVHGPLPSLMITTLEKHFGTPLQFSCQHHAKRAQRELTTGRTFWCMTDAVAIGWKLADPAAQITHLKGQAGSGRCSRRPWSRTGSRWRPERTGSTSHTPRHNPARCDLQKYASSVKKPSVIPSSRDTVTCT